MKEFTYSDARQHLAELLECAQRDGIARIRRRDGQAFIVRPEPRRGSPLDVAGIDLGLDRDEIVEIVRSARRPA